MFGGTNEPFETSSPKGQIMSLNTEMRDTWVARSVKHQTLDCGSGHDLTIREIEPPVGLYNGHRACLGFSLPLP